MLFCLSDSMHLKAQTVMETCRCSVSREVGLTRDQDGGSVVGWVYQQNLLCSGEALSFSINVLN